jgi:hypothetical protein
MSSIIKGLTSEQEVTNNQSEIQVPGYGTMPLDMLKRHVQSLSKEFNDSIQKGEFLKAAYRTEQFYNALMALAKALKQQGVSETSSTGMGGGSAGIGGGAGLGIDKSPMEKVLEKPLGEGELPPKAGFNPRPMKKGPGTSKDDYEYTAFVPRGEEDKEAWAIKKTVARQKIKPTTLKSLDTGFYKNYLSNRPVREEEVEEEQAPMFTPEEKIVNMNDPRSDGWRVYKAKSAGTKESSIMKGIQSESVLSEGNPINIWATMSGRGQGGIPANLRASEIPVHQIGTSARIFHSYKETKYYNIMSGNAYHELAQEYKRKGKEPDIEKIKSQIIKLAKAAGLEQDTDGKWFFDVYTPLTKERKSHMTYLEYNFGIPYDKKQDKSKKKDNESK